MALGDGLLLKVGDKFEHKKFTGVYTIEEIEVLPKTIKLKCNDGYTYTHRSIKKLVNR